MKQKFKVGVPTQTIQKSSKEEKKNIRLQLVNEVEITRSKDEKMPPSLVKGTIIQIMNSTKGELQDFLFSLSEGDEITLDFSKESKSKK